MEHVSTLCWKFVWDIVNVSHQVARTCEPNMANQSVTGSLLAQQVVFFWDVSRSGIRVDFRFSQIYVGRQRCHWLGMRGPESYTPTNTNSALVEKSEEVVYDARAKPVELCFR